MTLCIYSLSCGALYADSLLSSALYANCVIYDVLTAQAALSDEAAAELLHATVGGGRLPEKVVQHVLQCCPGVGENRTSNSKNTHKIPVCVVVYNFFYKDKRKEKALSYT